MLKKKEKQNLQQNSEELSMEEKYEFLKRKTIKQLIAPAGIDASNIDHLEIISDTTRFARSFFVYSDGEYEWCDFLVYHIEHYNIRLPKEFIDKIEMAQ